VGRVGISRGLVWANRTKLKRDRTKPIHRKGDECMPESINRAAQTLMARMDAEEGQTMVEYAFLVAFIAVIVLVGVQLLGTNLLAFFNSVATNL
jgi:pilus assembly protein Flp/PilA